MAYPELVKKAKNGDRKALCSLLKDFEPMIENVARKYEDALSFRGDFDDLLQIGREGFIHAVESYDQEKSPAFIPYAREGVKIAIRDYLSKDIRLVRLPKSAVEKTRKLSDAYMQNAIFTTCLSRNRDLNGNGVIDDNELRWYMPAVNEYIRIGMGANAIPNEAQLYVGDKSALTVDGYPSSFISNGALYHTSTYGGAKVTFWAVEKGSYGDQMSTYNGGRYMIRCIRILPDDVDAESCDGKVSAAIYQEKETSNGNYLFDFRGRLTPSLFRQVRNTAPYNFLQHDEDDERNRFYDGLVLAKDYMSSGWSTWGAVTDTGSDIYNTLKVLQNIGNNQSNPCASYHEAGEPANAGWRLPNLVEMTVMASDYDRYIADGMPNRGQGNLPCCTQFSNWAVRQAFYVNTREMVTCGDDYNSHQNFYIRCVRDATDEELATATASSN